jgi:Txe/YoeB family toxin of Txe-Axe toxin-antitoxin module
MPISQRKYDDIHDANIDRYLRRIKKAYNEVINKVANKSVGVKLNANKEFYFRNHPKLNKKVNELLKKLNA